MKGLLLGQKDSKKTIIIAITIVAIVAAAALTVLLMTGPDASPGGANDRPAPAVPVTIGMEPNQVNSLIIIADNRGFFTANGLNVTIRNYPSGAAAVDGMMNGDSDIAMAAEFVLVGKALSRTPVKTLASVDRFQHIHLIGRSDRGILNIPDLKGKRIGVPRKTAGEFYLGRFLLLHGMGMSEIIPVNIPPQQSADAIANGTVDAIVAWQPNVRVIEARFANGTVNWPAQGGQPAYCIAVAPDSWIGNNPDAAYRLVNAIRQSESFAVANPVEARAIVRDRLKYDDAFMGTVWPEHQFSLTLDQSLILAMEDEARWMIANNMTNATGVPDFRKYISTEGLLKVKPGSVNIISPGGTP
jgi:NitT/TauT family transport system substrate-binding protein